MTRLTRGGGLLLLVPMLAAIAFSWGRIVSETFDVPADADYVAARAILDPPDSDGGFDRARDALVILPPWSLRPLSVVGDLEPLSGDAIADRPLHRWARLWAIVEPDADRERDALVERRGPPSFSRRAGRVVVERWDLPAPSVAYDLAANIEQARVRVVDADGPRECTPSTRRRGWQCGKEGWQRVAREWLLVSENADLAVSAHPPAKGGRLELEWTGVPIGASVVLTAGFTRDGAHARAPVRVRVLVDGELAGTVMRAPAFLFATEVIDTARFGGERAGRTGTLTIAVDSEDNSGAHFAFDAYVVSAP